MLDGRWLTFGQRWRKGKITFLLLIPQTRYSHQLHTEKVVCREYNHAEDIYTLKNWCFWTVVSEKTLESPLDCKEIQKSILKEISPEYSWKDWCWSWNSTTVATWFEELTHWKRPWCWERLKAGGEGDDRGWDGWMASPTRWTWVWVSSGSWWWTSTNAIAMVVACCRPWDSKESDMTERPNRLTDWHARVPSHAIWQIPRPHPRPSSPRVIPWLYQPASSLSQSPVTL